ncbi:MAG: hypothetical protein IH586_20810 [Anaerolineaceae bacterium]|nr:hypothetical protein [Anaerolineaceae bacterium]
MPVTLSYETPFRRKFSSIFDTLQQAELDFDQLPPAGILGGLLDLSALMGLPKEKMRTDIGVSITAYDDVQKLERFHTLPAIPGCWRCTAASSTEGAGVRPPHRPHDHQTPQRLPHTAPPGFPSYPGLLIPGPAGSRSATARARWKGSPCCADLTSTATCPSSLPKGQGGMAIQERLKLRTAHFKHTDRTPCACAGGMGVAQAQVCSSGSPHPSSASFTDSSSDH